MRFRLTLAALVLAAASSLFAVLSAACRTATTAAQETSDSGPVVTDGGVEAAADDTAIDFSLKECASPDGGCFGHPVCDPHEVCFTQVGCGPASDDGGSSCGLVRGFGARGDDRCHVACGEDGRGCPPGQACFWEHAMFACSDVLMARGICCPEKTGCAQKPVEP